MPRALITGITGFVGPWLAGHFRERSIVCAGIARGPAPAPHPIGLDGLRIHDVDIRDRDALRGVLAAEKPDIVVHLAALSHVPTSWAQPELAFEVNAAGTFNLLEGLRTVAPHARTVVVSSGNLYGHADSGAAGFSEDSPLQLTSPYATSKRVAELLAESYAREFGMSVVIARPFNHTGPGQPPAFACPEFASKIAAGAVHGRPVHMKTGPLEPCRDISDVRDVVRAYALLADRGKPGEIYNVCSGSSISMGAVIAMLAEMAGVPVTTELDPARMRPQEIMHSGGNCDKIRRDLGWVPEISLSTTLRDILNYWIERVKAEPAAAGE